MTNPSNQTNPLDYPKYVRGLRPALPDSLGDYVETELEKIQNSNENLAVAADANTKTQVAELKISVDANTASITDEQTVRADADSALATRIDTVEATAGDNTAAITAEQAARADADSALSSDITTLSTTVDDNTASITTIQTSVNGLEAKYGVELNVNGYVTGWQANNDGSSGSFIITADRFAIVDPGAVAGDPGTAPFEVVNGQTYIQDAFIQNLDVGKLTGGTLDTGGTPITQNSDWNYGTGKAIFDNGTVMKVAGVGFGTNGQFIEWFGPHLDDYNLCDESNATYYLKIDGSAYFGGSLQAGVIHNAAQTTSIATNASITVGDFSSNGGAINVSCSYSYSHTFLCDAGSGSVSGSGSATVIFDVSSDSGSTWTTLATLTADITGTVTTLDTKDHVRVSGGTANTSVWTPGDLTTLQIRARLTSWSGPTVNGTNITEDILTQDLSVEGTEQ